MHTKRKAVWPCETIVTRQSTSNMNVGVAPVYMYWVFKKKSGLLLRGIIYQLSHELPACLNCYPLILALKIEGFVLF